MVLVKPGRCTRRSHPKNSIAESVYSPANRGGNGIQKQHLSLPLGSPTPCRSLFSVRVNNGHYQQPCEHCLERQRHRAKNEAPTCAVFSASLTWGRSCAPGSLAANGEVMVDSRCFCRDRRV